MFWHSYRSVSQSVQLKHEYGCNSTYLTKNLHISPKILMAGTVVGEAIAGFTLAEVLLTLTIVAVVASLTIPPLVNNVQQAQFNSGAQNAYQLLSQALMNIQNQNGGAVLTLDGSDFEVGLMTQFCSVLQCVKKGTKYSIFAQNYYYYKSSNMDLSYTADGTNSAVALNNGYLISFWHNYIFIDINGNSPPNMYGEDMNTFTIVLNNGVYSLIPGDGGGCSIGSEGGCTYTRIFNPNGLP